MKLPRVLVIAGSDSSGGAGLEADQKVLAAHGVFAMTATTALTAQNTMGVEDIHPIPTEFVKKQIRQVLSDIDCNVVKIGMLASAATIEAVAETLEEYNITTLVLDPVMVATSGAMLLPDDAVPHLRKSLLPAATILTPNIPEALLLLQDAGLPVQSPENLEQIKELAKKVHGLGPKAVLLKGGHIPFTKDYSTPTNGEAASLVADVLFDGVDMTLIETPFLTSNNTHGTGCSLASAIAANIALGQGTASAVKSACRYVEAGIRSSRSLGRGRGPINHFHSAYHLPFAQGRFFEYLLDRPDIRGPWKKFVEHDFVRRLGTGTLQTDIFKNYLVQDYLYLTHFARSNALAACKSLSMDQIATSAGLVLHVQKEMAMHLDYCKQFRISKADIESTKESTACMAYSRYILDVGHSQDLLALNLALAPCLLGYQAAAQFLDSSSDSVKEGNPYWSWVENYIGLEHSDAVRKGSALVEMQIHQQAPGRIEELIAIFVKIIELEICFWDCGEIGITL